MTIENMEFLGEEIILRAEKIEKKDNSNDAFAQNAISSDSDTLSRFKVIKVGEQQKKLKVDDYVLVNKNGLFHKPLTIEGIVLENTYALPTHLKIFCKLNE